MKKILQVVQPGNRGLWGSIALFVGDLGTIANSLAHGEPISTVQLLAAVGSLIAIFGFLKGKRIEAKLDTLHEKVGPK